MFAPEPAATANQRFKTRSSNRTGVSLLGAVAVHLAIFLVAQPFEIADLSAAEEQELRVVIPEVRLPEPPPQIPRPSLPIMGDVALDLERTVAPNDFEYYDRLPPAPPVTPDDSNQIRFIAYDTPPALKNRDEIAGILRREYPPGLRRSGVEGRVLLWLFVDETGVVTRSEVKESSGSAALDDAAMRVAERMEFQPAKNRDRETSVWVQQWVTFRIR
jgi:TonB family protein